MTTNLSRRGFLGAAGSVAAAGAVAGAASAHEADADSPLQPIRIVGISASPNVPVPFPPAKSSFHLGGGWL